jgi:molybdenum cofactor cytidylyltransferase
VSGATTAVHQDAEPDTIDCVVPAAGCSRRMGQWKPLLRFQDATIIETVVGNALAACGRVILVVGFRGQELARRFQRQAGVVIAENPDWERGMFSSIQRGAAEVASARFFITPGDMPWLRPEVYRALRANAPGDAVFPVFDGRRGHPVLVSQRVRDAVLEADPDSPSMRHILSGFAVLQLAWRDDSIHRDIDTVEDYP